MRWPKTAVVWKWEFFQRVRSKSFLFSLLFVPFVFFLFTVLPAAFLNAPSHPTTVGLAGFEDWQIEQLKTFAPETLRFVGLPDAQPSTSGPTIYGLDAVLYGNGKAPRLLILSPTDSTQIIQATHEIMTKLRLQNLGVNPTDLAAAMEPVPYEMHVDAPTTSLQNYQIAITIVMMLFFAMFNSSGAFLRSLSEERHNRIMEVLIATVEPGTLMTGKILGLACVGLLQLAIWSLLGLALTDTPFFEVLEWHHWALIVVYFLLGYLFYTGLFATIGSLLSSESDIQHLQAVLSILGLLPAALLVVIIGDPYSWMVTILSYLPLITPTLLPLRIILSDISWVHIAATLLLMVASSVTMIVFAGRVFKAATLLRGSATSVKLKEVLR